MSPPRRLLISPQDARACRPLPGTILPLPLLLLLLLVLTPPAICRGLGRDSAVDAEFVTAIPTTNTPAVAAAVLDPSLQPKLQAGRRQGLTQHQQQLLHPRPPKQQLEGFIAAAPAHRAASDEALTCDTSRAADGLIEQHQRRQRLQQIWQEPLGTIAPALANANIAAVGTAPAPRPFDPHLEVATSGENSQASSSSSSTSPLRLTPPIVAHGASTGPHRASWIPSLACQDQPRSHRQASMIRHLRDALHVMQRDYFELWVGVWPTAIDWTAAVVNTHLVAALHVISRAADIGDGEDARAEGSDVVVGSSSEPVSDAGHCIGTCNHSDQSPINLLPPPVLDPVRLLNELDGYFAQTSAFYFGEDAFSVRNEAFDDMLWIVLEWLEAIQLINGHSNRHYKREEAVVTGAVPLNSLSGRLGTTQGPSIAASDSFSWHAEQFIPAFAHRARIFWDLASRGWDTVLCGGGMVWNPRLVPYKNAITNQLYISASIGMYLHFPGDSNKSPFVAQTGADDPTPPSARRDPKYLGAAVEAYAWLRRSNMTNAQGLYVDGFHITGWKRGKSNGTAKCDHRDEMVYSYNQGVILSGLRGLWTATGQESYLDDGHTLIRNVMAATGWVLPRSPRPATPPAPVANSSHYGHPTNSTRWAGLGRRGILEESCDFAGNCAQDPQTFKAIFWHHLRVFCRAIEPEEEEGAIAAAGTRLDDGPPEATPGATSFSHRERCATYKAWVRWNAQAALRSRDEDGRFGMWWRADDDVPGRHDRYFGLSPADAPRLPAGAEDRFAPDATVLAQHRPFGRAASSRHRGDGVSALQLRADLARADPGSGREGETTKDHSRPVRDPNLRGRGRTVETQSGGVAVLAAWWEFENL